MYHRIITQGAHSLAAIDGWLDKAERHAAARGTSIKALLHARLAPDMGHFLYQVQSACDYLKGSAAWLSGQHPPVHEDTEQSLADIRARIARTLAFVRGVDATRYAAAAEQRVRISWAPANTVIDGEDYLVEVIIPNVYFHIVAAYAILRNAGVEVGKMDFLGTVHFVPA